MKFKKLIGAGFKYVFDKNYRFMLNSNYGKYSDLDDETYLKKKFKIAMGYDLNLDNPVTFSEKLQWLKLYDRNPKYTIMSDKVLAKEYVAEIIGEEYIIPNIGVWDSPDEIDFDTLPDKFAMKCNHNSGLGMCICHDKSKLDIENVKRELKKGLKQDYFLPGREWAYKNIPHKIIAEQYLENDEDGLTDYKIHCMNGKPRFILVCQARYSDKGLTQDFYSTDWERYPVKRPTIPNAKEPMPKPEKLEEMLQLAEKLAKDIPFVRVDFYCVEGKIYFSELTFYPTSGFSHFEPEEWDKTFGDWLILPEKK